MKDCPFCNIDADKTQVIARRKGVCVVLSNPRLTEGHLLVIPERHIEAIWELSEEEKKVLWQTLQEFESRIVPSFAPGCDLKQHYRPFISNSKFKVSHLHFHLIPRFNEDELYLRSQIHEKDIFQDLSPSEREKFTRMLGDSMIVAK